MVSLSCMPLSFTSGHQMMTSLKTTFAVFWLPLRGSTMHLMDREERARDKATYN